MALLCPLVTNTVSRALVGANVNLCLALDASEACSAKAVAVVALASICGTVGLACLVTTRVSLPSNLAQASGIITTVTVLAVWAHSL